MKRFFFALLVCCLLSFLPQAVFAWGSGHATMSRAVAANLPEPWKSLLQEPETMAQFLRDNLYPDSFDPITVDRAGEEAVRHLESVKVTRRYDFHSDKGRAVAFSLLVEAIRDNKPDRVFLWLGALAHSTADMPACNHDPLVHTATYIWNEKSWNLDSPLRNEGCVDLSWLEKYAWSKEIFAKSIEAQLLPDDGADGAESLLRVMLYGYEGVDVCSPHGRTIIEDGSRWALRRDREAGERVAAVQAELGAWAAVRIVRDFHAALRLAKTDAVVKYDGRLQAEFDKRVDQLLRERSLNDDSIARDILFDNSTAPSVAVLYEPAWRMNDGVFTFGDRVIACQVVGSLRSLGRSAGLLDVRTFQRDGIPDVTKTPILIVPATSFNSYRILDRKVLAEKLNDYLKRNGKILWVGGNRPPAEIFPELSAAAKPLPNGEVSALKILSDFGNGKKAEWSFVRPLKGAAGWNWPPAPCSFEKNERFRILLKLPRNDETFDIGVGFPNDSPRWVFLPSTALFPYVLTDETPEWSSLSLKLDSVGTLLVDRSVRLLLNE